MILTKQKSKSKEIKDHSQHQFAARYALIHKIDKELKHGQFKKNRKYSNQYLPSHAHVSQTYLPLKIREFSSAKNYRKEHKYPEKQLHHPLKIVTGSPFENNSAKKSVKTFIGFKLKRKLEKYFLFLSLINFSLRFSYKNHEEKQYKIFVGKGNNSKLIKNLFLKRYWWKITNNQKEANFIWTQVCKRSVMNKIEVLEKEQKYHLELDNDKVSYKKQKRRLKQKEDSEEEQFYQILSENDHNLIKSHCKKESFVEDLRSFLKGFKQPKRKAIQITHNHLENHKILTNKKNLFYSLKSYCEENNAKLYEIVPITFHIKHFNDIDFDEIKQFQNQILNEITEKKQKLLWIVKPGENSNRGCGIEVCKRVEQVKKWIQKEKIKFPERTFIVQKYIFPFLFHRRKFDIRCFTLVTATPQISAYFYPIGYIRTSSFQFSIKNCTNKFIHLTNDAIQKKTNQYSKFQSGNKVTFQEFQTYLDLFFHDNHYNFFQQILPHIKKMVQTSIRSANNFGQSQKEHTFQILGYDFMIDDNFKPWLIEINRNPCLETGCDILNDVIPSMLENAMKIAIDPIFKPPKLKEWPLNELLTCSEDLLENNKFQLIYSELNPQQVQNQKHD